MLVSYLKKTCIVNSQLLTASFPHFQSYGDLVAAGSHDGDLIFWDINSGNCEGIIVGHTGPLHCISFYGTRFVTGGG